MTTSDFATQTSKSKLPRRFFPLGLGILSITALTLLGACGPKIETPDTTRKVWFGNLADGQEVSSPLVVEMKAQNLVVEPAATGITDGHGHFHILIDVPDANAPKAPNPIPFDEQHIHFGGGQTETTLDLAPGDHTLTLLFATGDHVPYEPSISQTIRVKVVE